MVALLGLIALVVPASCGPGTEAGGPAQSPADSSPTNGGRPAQSDPGAHYDSAVGPDYRPHSALPFTVAEVSSMLETAPEPVRRAALENPAVFLEYLRRAAALPEPVLALVDKDHPLPPDYAPADLVELSRYAGRLTLNREGLSLRALIIPDLFAMVEAARLDGIILDISSAYRSYGYQETLFDYWVSELGLEEAARVSARAGTSQHQLGTTVDFGSITPAFADHPAGRWLADHAWRFGFSLSYPRGYEELTGYSFEPWHFRWVSRPVARLEREFFDGVQQHLMEFWHRHADRVRRLREQAEAATVSS